jgi:hypothetical protein
LGATLRTNYVLIDYENVQVKSLALLDNEQFQVKIFLGINNTKLSTEFVLSREKLGSKAEYIKLEKAGENALDFHIAFYLGLIVSKDPTGFFHIISKDKGFDPLISHLKSIKVFSSRSESIEEMPCFSEHHTKVAAVKSAPKTSSGTPANISERAKLSIKHLIGLKASKPRKLKSLKSTIHAKLGKQTSNQTIETIITELKNLKYIETDDQKVSYKFPSKLDF